MKRTTAISLALVLAFASASGLTTSARAADVAKDKPAAKLKKNQTWVAPDWEARAIRSIAVAPMRSVDRNAEAEALARKGLEAALAGKPYRFRPAQTFMESVKRGNAEPAWTAASAAAAKSAPFDTTSASTLKTALTSDAVLVATVTNWQRYVVDEQTRGASFTQVGVDLAMYSLADGALVWRGSFVEKGDGPYNEPVSGDATQRDPSGYNSARKAALEPPLYEEVIEKLMTRVASSLPKPAAAAAAPAKS